jgi:lipoprotein-releasing system permease protein
MPSNAVLFLARRYLRAKRSFVSIITVISVLGVALGVLAMIVVNAVMQGFEGEFRRVLIGYQPHMLIKPADGKPADPADVEAILAKLRSKPEVASSTAYTGGIIYLEREGAQTATELYGLPPAGAAEYLQKIEKHLLDGSLNLRDGDIVTADMQAAEMNAHSGDKLAIYASSNVTTAVRRFRTASDLSDEKERHTAYKDIKLHPLPIQLLGYLRSESAGHYAYATQATAQKVFGLGEKITGAMVEVRQPNDIKAFHQRLLDEKIIPDGWKAVLWTDVGDARLAAMSNERFMMFFIISIIGLVAAFAVMNTTITVTTQKRREIGVLTSLGARQGQIVRIFVFQAAVVGVVGTLAGLIFSGLVLTYRNEIRALLAGGASTDGLFLSTIPAHIDPVFITATCIGSILLCLFAALPPAWLASRVDPAVALRD